MARLKIFDTNALIAISQGQLNIGSQNIHVMISVITRIEFLAWPELTDAERDQARRLVNSVETAPLSSLIEEWVIELRNKRLLKFPDAIVAATALSFQAPLVTNDTTFERVSGLLLERF